jgi:hypothetical protein
MAKNKNTFHVQCHLHSNNYVKPHDANVCTTHYVAWIPEEFAVLGKHVRLKDVRGHSGWTNWIVVNTGTKLESQYVFDHERDYITQRKASDI